MRNFECAGGDGNRYKYKVDLMRMLNLRPVGRSTGTVFHQEMLAEMRLGATDTVYGTWARDG
jgi:hypothetical protein